MNELHNQIIQVHEKFNHFELGHNAPFDSHLLFLRKIAGF